MLSLQVCRDSEHNWLYHEIREYSQLQEAKAALAGAHNTTIYTGLLEVEEELGNRRLLEVEGERSWTGELGSRARRDQTWAHL